MKNKLAVALVTIALSTASVSANASEISIGGFWNWVTTSVFGSNNGDDYNSGAVGDLGNNYPN